MKETVVVHHIQLDADGYIMRPSRCKPGSHNFAWTSSTDHVDEPIDDSIRCDCGLYTWAEAKADEEGKRERVDQR